MAREIIASVRGMRTIWGEEAQRLETLLGLIRQLLQQSAYGPISLPLLEKTSLFQRAVGEETDVVSKEMYTFLDRNEESVTLRPEATAGVVRALIENGLLQQPHRLYSEGPMFRYEKPQKGRYRQFYQVSVEAFGSASPVLDAELIQLGHRLFQKLGVRDLLTLEINSIGLAEERQRFQTALVDYLRRQADALDPDSRRRLDSNPLRILDSKEATTQALLDDAPVLDDYLGAASRAHFQRLCQTLDELGISYRRNPRLVRGLDYYNHTVFEWTTQALGAQGTVCAGGRYDGLVEQLGGPATPASGFAFGVDRIYLLAEQVGFFPAPAPLLYALASREDYLPRLLATAARLREALPALRVQVQTEVQALKKQLQKADKSGARYALILGDDEFQSEHISIKNLQTGQQQTLTPEGLVSFLQEDL